MIETELAREADAARALTLSVRELLAGDDDAIEDAIEGETNFKEAVAHAVARLAEIDALTDAIKTQRDNLAARAKRLDVQSGSIRAALIMAMETAGLTKLELAQATLSRKPLPSGLAVNDEASIPSEWWKRADPTLDKRALLSALKDGATIPGVALSNGGETIAIRFK